MGETIENMPQQNKRVNQEQGNCGLQKPERVKKSQSGDCAASREQSVGGWRAPGDGHLREMDEGYLTECQFR